MVIKTSVREGDVIQFPSHSLKKVLQIQDNWIIFGAMRKPKKGTTYSCHVQKRSTYFKDFVFDYCYLVPSGVDLQHWLNETYSRRSVLASAPIIDAYSDATILKGYIIDDEEIVDMPPIENDD